MEKIIEGHLVGFGTVRDMQHLEGDYYGEFTDAGMSETIAGVDKSLPTKEACERLCSKMSGEVMTYNIKTK